MSLFMRASCGCIVLAERTVDDKHIVIKPCNGGRDSFGDKEMDFFPRDLEGKSLAPILVEEERSIIRYMQEQLAAGRRFWEVQMALGVKE